MHRSSSSLVFIFQIRSTAARMNIVMFAGMTEDPSQELTVCERLAARLQLKQEGRLPAAQLIPDQDERRVPTHSSPDSR